MNSTIKTDIAQPTLPQTIGAILVAAFMWGSGNVLSRSLLIEGVNEIFLVTLRVTLIGSVLFLNYFSETCASCSSAVRDPGSSEATNRRFARRTFHFVPSELIRSITFGLSIIFFGVAIHETRNVFLDLWE